MFEEIWMNIERHDASSILSNAVEHGNTVYLAGVVAKSLDKDVKGQTKEIVDEIDRLLAKCGSSKSKLLSATIWVTDRSEEHTSELQSRLHLVCRLLLEKKKTTNSRGHVDMRQ